MYVQKSQQTLQSQGLAPALQTLLSLSLSVMNIPKNGEGLMIISG